MAGINDYGTGSASSIARDAATRIQKTFEGTGAEFGGMFPPREPNDGSPGKMPPPTTRDHTLSGGPRKDK